MSKDNNSIPHPANVECPFCNDMPSRTPNETTIAAMREAELTRQGRTFDSLEEMHDAILKENSPDGEAGREG